MTSEKPGDVSLDKNSDYLSSPYIANLYHRASFLLLPVDISIVTLVTFGRSNSNGRGGYLLVRPSWAWGPPPPLEAGLISGVARSPIYKNQVSLSGLSTWRLPVFLSLMSACPGNLRCPNLSRVPVLSLATRSRTTGYASRPVSATRICSWDQSPGLPSC